jgi:hypothetical protein
MTEHPADPAEIEDASAPASWELSLDALRLAGAARLDPVRFRYIELLARRVVDASPDVRTLLLSTLERSLAECGERVAARAADEPPAPPEPPMTSTGATEPPGNAPLADLNRYIASVTEPPADPADYDLAPSGWQPFEGLKNAGRFRESWQKMRAEDALGLAVERAPEAAGPLNSHRLVLRTLTLMHGLSPAYMRHFIEQAETLLWLDRASARFRQPAPKPKQGRGKG